MREKTWIGENVRKTFDLSMGLAIDFIVPHWGNFSRTEKLEDRPEIKCHHHQELVERAEGSTKRIED